MWRGALGRLAVIFAVVVVATAAISVSLGALAHRNLAHSLGVGYYVAGCGALVATLGFGFRGPNRKEYGERSAGQVFSFGGFGGPRRVRRTTAEERSESRRNSLLFFAFGIVLIAIGAAIDPTRSLV